MASNKSAAAADRNLLCAHTTVNQKIAARNKPKSSLGAMAQLTKVQEPKRCRPRRSSLANAPRHPRLLLCPGTGTLQSLRARNLSGIPYVSWPSFADVGQDIGDCLALRLCALVAFAVEADTDS